MDSSQADFLRGVRYALGIKPNDLYRTPDDLGENLNFFNGWLAVMEKAVIYVNEQTGRVESFKAPVEVKWT